MMRALIRYSVVFVALPLSLVSCSKRDTPSNPMPAQSAVTTLALSATPAVAAAPPSQGPTLRVAYSDWPGWVAWEIAIQKGWFKEAGVNVDFKWFEYIPSMEAFSAGKVDAVTMTNGDALVTGSSGAPSVCIVANDYSNGNDMIVAKPGIKSVQDLKGKKVGVEKGFVDHLLLLNALKAAGMADKDIKLVDIKTDEAPQSLKSGSVDAVAAWQPNSGAALKEVAGSSAIYTSANSPGLIYDHLCVNPKSLSEHREDWKKVVQTWFRIASFLADTKNLDEAAKIMSARVGLTPAEYKPLMRGTFFLDKEGNLNRYKPGEGLESIFGSSKIVDAFNVKHGVYKHAMKVEDYFDAGLL
ncbi:MAG TPA: ABC transporter substrate-binding protein [Polyangiaceae bacterium]